jgi:uncharacterized damage-inducible protein DinB
MTTDRIDPPPAADERTMLSAWLDYERSTLQIKCDGLDADQLVRMAVPPSTLSLIGLVRHMYEVERGWFSRTMIGAETPPKYYGPGNDDGEFDDVSPDQCADDMAAWLDVCEQSRQIVAQIDSLDQECAYRRSGDEYPTLRWIMCHMIEEYARHNGHADLLREQIDGVTGE